MKQGGDFGTNELQVQSQFDNELSGRRALNLNEHLYLHGYAEPSKAGTCSPAARVQTPGGKVTRLLAVSNASSCCGDTAA